jgi:aryl-alcohol dehydrogenase
MPWKKPQERELNTQTIRAAVLRRSGGPLTIESLSMEEPRDDEVLVRLVASGICHTDIDLIDSWDETDVPVVLGHEGAGVVEKVGKDVREFEPGDPVVLSYAFCGRCRQCREGRPFACEHFWELNFDFRRLDGSNALERSGVRGHFFGQSSFASHALAAPRNLVPAPDDLPLTLLAPLGCGLQTGAGTVLHSLAVEPEEAVAVFGAGTVGLAAVMAARLAGAAPIIAVDRHPARLSLALELGATHVFDSRKDDVAACIAAIDGVDGLVETTGNGQLGRLVARVLKPQGRAAFLAGGITGPAGEGQRFLSVIQGDSVPRLFIPELIRHYRAGRFPFDRLVKFYDFGEINRAIDEIRRGDTIKAVLRIP